MELLFGASEGVIAAEEDAAGAVGVDQVFGFLWGQGVEGRGAIHPEILVFAGKLVCGFLPDAVSAEVGGDEFCIGEAFQKGL